MGDAENAPAGAFRHKMTEKATGPTWLKIGGLLTGVAALLTAIATIISTVVDVWPEKNSATDARESGQHTSQVASNDDQEDTTVSGVPKPLETIPNPNPLSPATEANVTNLVRYDGDGCFYKVDLLETNQEDVLVRFSFGLTTLVSARAIRIGRSNLSDLRRGALVFVPGSWANPGNGRDDFYAPATINDILGSTIHVAFEEDDTCHVSRKSVALSATEVLVERN